ncbi:MAG: GtrA family protein [Desulfatitalea sp.]|nr:GtrA family protein [Desulfatitalea sp.]
MISVTPWDCLARYLLAGGFVFVAGHGQYRLIHAALENAPLRAGVAWALHFMLGTLWSHALHRHYTFRHVPQLPYGISLARTCGAYLSLWALSTLMMLALCDLGGHDPMAGWVLTTLTAAAFNFVVMSRWSIRALLKGSVNGPDGSDPDRTYQKRST